MPSIIYYRFRSYKDYSEIAFEGAGLMLWELKHEIINQRKMVSKDYDLLFFDEENGEEIEDEYTNISRSSYIVVHRIPAWMGKGPAVSKERTRETAGSSTRSFKEPPENYVCFRCGNKGHFIQHCPTNNDKNFDIVKIKRPSGIPKDFLVKTQAAAETNTNTAMLVMDDGFVTAQPQTSEWQKQGTLLKGLGKIPKHLRCSECHGLLSLPVRANCGHLFCSECIQVENKCPICHDKIKSFKTDSTATAELEQFLYKK
ncbi:hypothetical protein ENBRE01_1341 [Enteropsectra breve]|nr:hypothetical protein ENBRE01_1341 [Enteropsectra breve]